MAQSESIAVIGAGVSGLYAAYRALLAGHSVTLYEPGTLGGLIRSQKLKGFALEQGPNVFVEKPCISALLDQLGLASRKRYPLSPRYRQMVWFEGKAQLVPKSPPALLRSPFFSAVDKLLLLPRLFCPGLLRTSQEDLSIASFLTPLVGKRAVEHLVNPAFKGIFGGDISTLSARSIFPELWKLAKAGGSAFSYMKSKKRAPVFVIEGGLQTLTDALWERLKSHVDLRREAVTELQSVQQGQFLVRTQGSSQQAQRVLVCTSGPASAGFLGTLDPALAASVDAISYASIIVLHYAIASDAAGLPENCFGVLFPNQAAPLLGVMYNAQLFPHLAPAGKQLLTVCIGGCLAGSKHSSLCVEPDSALFELGQQLLAERLGLKQLEPLAVKRWPRAIPQLLVGHHRLEHDIAACEDRFPGLAFLGVDRGGIGVPDRLQYVESYFERCVGAGSQGCVAEAANGG